MLQHYTILFDLLELLGKKWIVPLLLFLLWYDKTTFSKIKKHLGLTSRVLVKKLKLLAAMGFVERVVIDNPRKVYYTLSEKGTALAQFIIKIKNIIPI